MANKNYNLVGKRFGMLIVISEKGRSKHGDKIWECLCDCGNNVIQKTSELNRGCAKSCGANREYGYALAMDRTILLDDKEITDESKSND